MGLIGAVLQFIRAEVDGAKVAEVELNPGGNANQTAQHFSGAGEDAPPLPGDYVATADGAASGEQMALGYIDGKNAGEAGPGERRTYSRDSDGAVKAVLWLKADGTVVIENDGGGLIEMAPGGDVTINGVTITAGGDISSSGAIDTTGEISGLDVTATVTSISLGTHVHPTAALGPASAGISPP